MHFLLPRGRGKGEIWRKGGVSESQRKSKGNQETRKQQAGSGGLRGVIWLEFIHRQALQQFLVVKAIVACVLGHLRAPPPRCAPAERRHMGATGGALELAPWVVAWRLNSYPTPIAPPPDKLPPWHDSCRGRLGASPFREVIFVTYNNRLVLLVSSQHQT